jgi:hypothetical protein
MTSLPTHELDRLELTGRLVMGGKALQLGMMSASS